MVTQSSQEREAIRIGEGIITKNQLLHDLDRLHATPMSEARIRLNMKPDKDVVIWAKEIINNDLSRVTRRGKNYYVQLNNAVLTINAHSLTLITAHYIK